MLIAASGDVALLLIGAVVLLVWVLAAGWIGLYAGRKGYNEYVFFFLSLLTSPLLGGIVALLIQDRENPPVVRVESATPSGSRVDQLAKLAELRDSGALSEAEFEAEKARLLAGHEPPP